MQSENYKNSLKEALKSLKAANEDIFQSLRHILTQGDLKEWNTEVPIGEVHQFDWELFKNSEDTNIQLLVKLMESIDEAYQSIKILMQLRLTRKKRNDRYVFPPTFSAAQT